MARLHKKIGQGERNEIEADGDFKVDRAFIRKASRKSELRRKRGRGTDRRGGKQTGRQKGRKRQIGRVTKGQRCRMKETERLGEDKAWPFT